MKLRKFLKSKIHGAVVTKTSLDYEGSISLPPSIMKEGDIKEYEFVMVINKANGKRFETYVIKGEEGEVTLYGGAARLCYVGDEIFIFSFIFSEEEIKPKIIFVDKENRIKEIR
ncbi:MAG: aspartate 1-decarboxylase [candidate division WOR-3 bacterium]